MPSGSVDKSGFYPIVSKGVFATGVARSRAYSLLELIIALIIVASLVAVAFPRLWELQAEGERAAFEKVFGEIHSAVGIDVATFLASGDMAGLRSLGGSNPMERLAEAPWNYRGVVEDQPAAGAMDGAWYFDARERVLIYQVRNREYFRGATGTPDQARFAVRLVTVGESPTVQRVVGARFVVLEPYAWVLPGQQPGQAGSSATAVK